MVADYEQLYLDLFVNSDAFIAVSETDIVVATSVWCLWVVQYA